jgi:hypothetical protein
VRAAELRDRRRLGPFRGRPGSKVIVGCLVESVAQFGEDLPAAPAGAP